MLLASVFPDIHGYSVNANGTIGFAKAGCPDGQTLSQRMTSPHHDFPKDDSDI